MGLRIGGKGDPMGDAETIGGKESIKFAMESIGDVGKGEIDLRSFKLFKNILDLSANF